MGPIDTSPPAPNSQQYGFYRRTRLKRRIGEGGIHGILLLCALVTVATTAGIIAILFTETVEFFRSVPIIDFLFGTKWTPNFVPQNFGVLPLVGGTLLVALGASVVALPIGLATAIFLSEYASDRIRRIFKPILELLAGIPTVVYGYFALTFVTPNLVRFVNPEASIFNAASAAIVVGIMIIPMVSSLSEDAMIAVPRSLRDGAYALGANPLQVAIKIVVPAALSGIISSFILALSRAIGETMIVTIAAGSIPNLTANPFEGVQTMTAYIAQTSLGDTPQGTIEFYTIFSVAMALFTMTFLMNFLANLVVRRYKEIY